MTTVRRRTTSSRRRALSQNEAGLRHGWRSGLEEGTAAQLAEAGIEFAYEPESWQYTQPEKPRKYTVDFRITTRTGRTIYIETKGRWTREDRLKMKLIVEQHPEKDIRMVFQRASTRIAKNSKTTYAAWCEKNLGIPWADKCIPQGWLDE